MSSAVDYSQLVARAEQAVAGVKDAELKRVAFQKVLDDLLGTQPAESKKKVRIHPKAATNKTHKATKGGPQAYVEELAEEDFFKKQKTIAQVKAELENRGHHIPLTSLSGPLQKLCQRKVLRRQKTNSSGKKTTFAYSEW